MKYLKLITEPKLDNRHITFAYFGKNEGIEINESLNNLTSFDLEYSHEDMYGPNQDIHVSVYTIKNDNNNIIEFRSNFIKSFGKTVEEQNKLIWSPHISHEGTPVILSIKVTGIISNDETFKVEFSN